MPDQLIRTELIFGKEGMARLRAAKVAVFGIGGVGGHAVEALARSGIGGLDLIDDDTVCITNLNRQLHTTRENIGLYKVDVAKARITAIDPAITVSTHRLFYLPETAARIDLASYDYVIDAIDTITAKIELAVRAGDCGVPIISSMGAGNKVDPTALRVADIYATSVCPLARVMRNELRKRGVAALKVVYSTEPPLTPRGDAAPDSRADGASHKGTARGHGSRRQIPGSNAFVPPAAGLIIAAEVVKDLLAAAL